MGTCKAIGHKSKTLETLGVLMANSQEFAHAFVLVLFLWKRQVEKVLRCVKLAVALRWIHWRGKWGDLGKSQGLSFIKFTILRCYRYLPFCEKKSKSDHGLACELTPSWSVARPPHQLAMEPPCLHLRLKAETQIYWVRVRVNVYAFIPD